MHQNFWTKIFFFLYIFRQEGETFHTSFYNISTSWKTHFETFWITRVIQEKLHKKIAHFFKTLKCTTFRKVNKHPKLYPIVCKTIFCEFKTFVNLSSKKSFVKFQDLNFDNKFSQKRPNVPLKCTTVYLIHKRPVKWKIWGMMIQNMLEGVFMLIKSRLKWFIFNQTNNQRLDTPFLVHLRVVWCIWEAFGAFESCFISK